ncbi:AraC family transcriptional regulator [Mariniflexile sp.]|uniref:AraC family transcriptional regulator n=1 Tax=Mariniflexile sp. TaxID=1979402 RepID=UPI0040478DCC
MKPLIQKSPVTTESSFVARTYKTPHFEVPWHQHDVYELILITAGNGLCFIGNYVGEFDEGDVFFLGKNLAHTFQKSAADLTTSAIVVQFKDGFFYSLFSELHESLGIRELFKNSFKGLKVSKLCQKKLLPLIKDLEFQKGFDRIITLLSCLNMLSKYDNHKMLSTKLEIVPNQKETERIEKVFQYSIANYEHDISLSTIADIAGMTAPAFCNYFKKRTKKTYVSFLNEIRIGAACQKLIATDKNVLKICFESGFNTVANFNSQFLKIKGVTPLVYRKSYRKIGA